MRCRHCGHTAEQHDNAGACHVRVLTGWKEDIKYFTGERPCGCDHYSGRFEATTVDTSGCPHEITPESPRCVHCGRLVLKEKSDS